MQGASFSMRKISYLLVIWMGLMVIGLVVYSTSDLDLFKWGPNISLLFLDIVIDTWTKWAALIIFITITQILKVFADEIISPFILNTIMDHKEKEMFFSYFETQIICQTYYTFSAFTKIIYVSIAISQIDCILVVIFTDIIVSIYTTHDFLRNKTYQKHDVVLASDDLEDYIEGLEEVK